MTESIISSLSNIFSNELIKTSIIFLLIPFLLKYYESNYLSDLAQKKNIWINFIQKNQHIQDCFSKFDELEKEVLLINKLNYTTMLKAAFSVFLLMFLITFGVVLCYDRLIDFLSNIQFLKTHFVAILTVHSVIQFIISLIFIVISMYLVSKSREAYDKTTKIADEYIIEQHQTIQKNYNNIIIFAGVITYFSIFSFLQNIYNVFFIVSGVLSSAIIYRTLKDKQLYAQKTKNSINNEYNKNFPMLEISTIGAEKFTGKLKNVFDYETITLIENDAEIKILWNAVAALKEQKTIFNRNQKRLDDFLRHK